MRLFPLVAVATLTIASPALAQSAATAAAPPAGDTIDTAGDHITVAAVGAYLPDYEGSNDYHFTPAPVAIGSIKGFNFSLIGNRFSADLIRDRTSSFDLQFGPTVVVNFNRDSIKSIHDTRIKALGELGTAIEVGGYVGFGKTGVITSPYDKLSASISYRRDVNKVHSSSVTTPSVTYLTPLSLKSAVLLTGSADYAEKGYAQTYFGVTPGQSLASGLPVWNPKAGWKSYTIGGAFTYAITGNLLHGFKLVAGGTYSHLMNDFGDSPLVRIAGSRTQWLGAAGIGYTF